MLLALLWFAWSQYAWLGNQARADEGMLRVAMIAAMGAMFVVALAIPEARTTTAGGLFAPFVLAACYATVRVRHLVVYLVAAGRGRRAAAPAAQHRRARRTAALLLLVAGGAGGPAGSRRCGCWRSSSTTSASSLAAPGWRLQRPRTSPSGTG